jgi:tetratricopeptide (TPR) repeat protein
VNEVRALRRIAVGAALFTALLCVAELALRAAGLCAPDAPTPLRLPGDINIEPFARPDPLLLYALVPESRTFPWYSIDRHGWRTPAFQDEKPADTLRVVVTGDSSTFGLGLAEEEHWPALLRRALTGLAEGDEPPRRIEVINAAVTGYSTHQNRLQIERDVLPLRPDLVLLMMTGVNDTKLLQGPGDLALFTEQRAWWRGFFRSHVACALGLGERGYLPWPAETPPTAAAGAGAARAGAAGTAAAGAAAAGAAAAGRPRLTLDEVLAELRAIEARLPGRLLLGLFPPHGDYPLSAACAEQAERAAGLAQQSGWPLVDLRPTLDALQALPVYADLVHPTPPTSAQLARAATRALLPHARLSDERTAWALAWFAAQAGGLPDAADVLTAEHAPPRFRALLALLAEEGIDARILAGDPSLPPAVRLWDPLHGARCRARSRAAALLRAAPAAQAAPATSAGRLAELDAHVRPADPLLACFPDEQAFLRADVGQLLLGRALIVYGAELGMTPWRTDLRAGQALTAADPRQAETLLRAVLALDPGDAEARFDLAFLLRDTGRLDEEREQLRQLALAWGPLADHARGVLAEETGDLATAEAAFRRAIAGAPSLGWAHERLASVLMREGDGAADRLARLDEAVRELTYAAMLLGTTDELPRRLAGVEVLRAKARGPVR